MFSCGHAAGGASSSSSSPGHRSGIVNERNVRAVQAVSCCSREVALWALKQSHDVVRLPFSLSLSLCVCFVSAFASLRASARVPVPQESAGNLVLDGSAESLARIAGLLVVPSPWSPDVFQKNHAHMHTCTLAHAQEHKYSRTRAHTTRKKQTNHGLALSQDPRQRSLCLCLLISASTEGSRFLFL